MSQLVHARGGVALLGLLTGRAVSFMGTRGPLSVRWGEASRRWLAPAWGVGPPEAVGRTVAPTGKGPTASLVSAGSSYQQRQRRQQRTRPPSPQDHGRSRGGLLGPAPDSLSPRRHPGAQCGRAEGAGEQAEGAGGVPPSHLPPGGRAVRGLARHPGPHAGEGSH